MPFPQYCTGRGKLNHNTGLSPRPDISIPILAKSPDGIEIFEVLNGIRGDIPSRNGVQVPVGHLKIFIHPIRATKVRPRPYFRVSGLRHAQGRGGSSVPFVILECKSGGKHCSIRIKNKHPVVGGDPDIAFFVFEKIQDIRF